VKLLLEKAPATADVQEKNGWTPIYIAAKNGHHGIVLLLGEKGLGPVEVLGTEGSAQLKCVYKKLPQNLSPETFQKESEISDLHGKLDKHVELSKSMKWKEQETACSAHGLDAPAGVEISGDDEERLSAIHRDLQDAIPHDFLSKIEILDPSASSTPYSLDDEAKLRYFFSLFLMTIDVFVVFAMVH
jgi:ankyrin repeat protein